MRLKSNIVSLLGLIWLSLPTIIFMMGWLRLEIGLPAAFLVAFAMVKTLNGHHREKTLAPLGNPCEELRVSPLVFGVLAMGVLLWCVMAGQGGFVVQTWDWNWRNATFRDLITHEWPVRYDAWNRALSFYVGHWLAPALVGKVVFAATGSMTLAWCLGNVALLIWTWAGVMIVLAQLLLLLGARSSRSQFCVFMLMVFWGGCGALGPILLSLEALMTGGDPMFAWWEFSYWWSGWYQFSPNSTCLYWVFHQTVAAWVAILLLARGARLSDSVFALSLVLIYAPLPAMGIAIFVVVLGVSYLVDLGKTGRWSIAVMEMLSFQNLVGMLVVAPVIALYLSINPQAGIVSFIWQNNNWPFLLYRAVLFLLCEVGLYFLLSLKWFGLSIWWRTAVVWLCICPLVRIGSGADFCMRASIPALMILSVMCYCSYIKYKAEGRCNWHARALLLCLFIGMLVPWREMTLYLSCLNYLGFGRVAEDHIVTFDRDLNEIKRFGENRGAWVASFCNATDVNATFFFSRLAKTRKEKENFP